MEKAVRPMSFYVGRYVVLATTRTKIHCFVCWMACFVVFTISTCLAVYGYKCNPYSRIGCLDVIGPVSNAITMQFYLSLVLDFKFFDTT